MLYLFYLFELNKYHKSKTSYLQESKNKRADSCIGELYIYNSHLPTNIPSDLNLKFHINPKVDKLLELQIQKSTISTNSRIVSGFKFDNLTINKDGTFGRFAIYKALYLENASIDRIMILRDSDLNEKLMESDQYIPYMWVEVLGQ